LQSWDCDGFSAEIDCVLAPRCFSEQAPQKIGTVRGVVEMREVTKLGVGEDETFRRG
jgi:hypothetical protein